MRSVKWTIAAAALLVSGASAIAADLPVKPVYKMPVAVAPPPTWTGCYIGGNLGADWGRASVGLSNAGSVSWTNSGFIGGGQVGCDYEFSGEFVVGARIMLDGTSLNSGATFNSGAAAGYTANSDTSWVATFTGRIGYAVLPNVLTYFQGGGAWTRQNIYVNNPGGAQIAQYGGNRTGWTVGGGVEWMFLPQWSTFLEYNYMDFGSSSGNTIVGGISYPTTAKMDAQTILVGVNYRF